MHRGFIKIWRKIEDNPLSHDPKFMATWMWILLLANHTKKEWKLGYKKIPVGRGQFITSRHNLSKIVGISESKIERLLNYLENEQQIEQQKYSKYRLITVLNYDLYQNVDSKTNSKWTASEQQVNTTKECKNEKNINKGYFIPPSIKEVSDYCLERNNGIDASAFVDHYAANGWVRGKTKIKDWKACVRTWEKNKKPTNKLNPDLYE